MLPNTEAEPLVSPRIQRLQEQLAEGNTAALAEFWREVEQNGSPVIEPIPGDGQTCLVTFVWREVEPVQNVVVFGPMVSRFPVENQLALLPGTDLRYKTYNLPRNLRVLYHLSINDTLLPYDGILHNWDFLPTWRADPLNPERFNPEPMNVVPDEALMSVLSLPDAPPQPWVALQPGAPKGSLHEHTIQSAILQKDWHFTVYTPPTYADTAGPCGLLVLFSGFYYLTPYIPGPTILDNMINAGAIPPLVTVFFDYNEEAGSDYACNPTFSAFLKTELVPWLRQHYRISTDASDAVVAGMSFTGMTAAYTALTCPEVFGNVLSQSGFFAWKPESDEEYEWLPRQFAEHPRLALRFALDAGMLETDDLVGSSECPNILISNRHMRTVLRAKGYPVHYVTFNGAHDGVSWRGTLSDSLIALLGGKE